MKNKSKTLPKSLFRYESITQYTLFNLFNRQVYFNSPLNFNDPFDCSHSVNFDLYHPNYLSYIFSPTAEDRTDLTSLKTDFENLLYNKITFDNAKKLFNRFISKYDPQDEELLTMKYFKVKNFEDLTADKSNNIEHIQMKLLEFLKDIVDDTSTQLITKARNLHVQNIGILCLSGNNKSIRMWSHYANNHKGICIEYNTEYEPFNRSYVVNYVESPPTIDPEIFLAPPKDFRLLTVLFCTKHKDWEEEKEFRVFTKKKGTKSNYASASIKAVYFGLKSSKDEIQLITTISLLKNPNIKFYQMKMSDISFELIAEEMIMSIE